MNRNYLSLAALIAVIFLGSTYAARAEGESTEAKATNKICPVSGEANGANSVTISDVGFDVAADGQRFALVRSGGDNDTLVRMILVQHWFEEFRGRR